MNSNKLIGKTISQLKVLIESGQVSCREILDAHLGHTAAVESKINAFNCLTAELAFRQADKIDQLRIRGEPLPPLAGIPVAIKDNICVKGYANTCSSKILDGYKPPYDATVVEHLLAAGALPIGKTNMDEFAMGSSTENSAFKITRNPFDINKVPGGSSGGSAAAVAAGSCVIALGSDTGGSIRQPASFCGVVGMKPTYGLVSRFGLVAFASSLDQIGPFGRQVEDVALTLEVIAGHDKRDATSLAESLLSQSGHADIKGMRIGIITQLSESGVDPDVKAAFAAAIDTFASVGATTEEVCLLHCREALPVYYLIANAEASANLARYDGVKYGYRCQGAEDLLHMYCRTRQEGFGAEVKRRIMLGTYALSSGYYEAYYKKAQQVRTLIKEDFARAFARFDLLICPTSPTVAFDIGAKTADPLKMYLCDIATIPVNLAGLPGISVPCGSSRAGLPVGLQLIGPARADGKLLKAAYVFEQANCFKVLKSPFLTAC